MKLKFVSKTWKKVCSYLDFLEAECALADVVLDHEWVIDHHTRLQEEAILRVCVLVQVRLVAHLTWHLAADRKLAEVKLCVVIEELKKCLTQVDLGLQRWLSLFLQEGDDHKEEGVGAEASRIRLFEVPDFQHLLQHEDHWLNQLRLV